MAIKTLKVRAAKHVYSWLHDSHQARFNVLYGGASSAKSWSMALYLLTEKFWKLPGVGLLVCRKTKPAVRTSCWRLVEHWLSEMGLWSSCKVNHTNLTITAPNGSFIQFAGLDDVEKLKCFSANTEVLTDRGFKLVSDVKQGDLLASMNPKTRAASFQPVSKTWMYDYAGPMICPVTSIGQRPSCVDFCVTPNHSMLVRTSHGDNLRFVEAKDLPGAYWIPRHATWDGVKCGSQDAYVRYTATVDYRGQVYGFEVPPHHTVLIRRNGKVMWCGQSVEGINYVWAEEATEIHERDLWQLHIRCRANNPYENNAVYLTFNPVDPIRNDWLRKITQAAPEGTYLKRPLRVRMVTYLDNPFLADEERATIEGLADSDDEYDKIYRQGKWATPSGVIYDNWDIVEEIPHVDDYGYGLDFGYTNATALIWCGIRDETDLYLREVLYETHLHNQELIERLAQLGVGRDEVIVADSSEPAYIDEIAAAGFNIHPCIKTGGQGDKSFVRTGINRVKRMRMHVQSESTNVTDELGSYKWRHTKDNDPLDEPVKFRDHAVDAIRYYVGSRPEPSETVVMQIPDWLRDQLSGG